jgi:outer membrane protein insertion porin family
VRSVGFRFAGRHALEPAELEGKIATTAPGTTDRLKSTVAWLPFVDGPSLHPFDPVTLQEDVVRLRRHYRRQGFLDAKIDYRVTTDRFRHRVSIEFLIEEGAPLELRSLKLADSLRRADGGAADSLGKLLAPEWGKLLKSEVGSRFREEVLEVQRVRLVHALQDRGYLFARLEPVAAIDSLAHRVGLLWVVNSGERVRIGPIEVAGLSSVPERTVTREIPLATGDWASRKQLEDGRVNVQSVPLFRRADLSVTSGAGADSVAPLRVTIQESRPRLTNLEAGYVTDGAGVSGQVRWTHPNFTGGARSLDAIALVQTGWGTTSEIPDKLIRISLPVSQPYVGAPAMTLSVGPAFEYRDGRIDRSTSRSLLATLVRRFNPLQSAALRYDFTYRELYELRFATATEDQVANVTLIAIGSSGLVDSLTAPTRTSQLIFFTNAGSLDDLSKPRHGFVLKPNLSVTVPAAWGNVEFARADVQATMFAPVPGRQNALMLRGTLGGLWPFGESIPPPGATPFASWLRLEDQLLTAGGANDVRGYESRLLGPKFPDVRLEINEGDSVLTSPRYIAIGGLRRFSATAELRLAPPRAPNNLFAHLFADAGRVWTTDERFNLPIGREDDRRVFYTTGGGLGYYTPVGAIRFDLGYKLNPSTYDVRHPQDVLEVFRAGRPVTDAPVDSRMRWVLHLALGLFF